MCVRDKRKCALFLIARTLYAQYGVQFAWLIDPVSKKLEAYKLRDNNWASVKVIWSDAKKARIPPFDAIELPVPWE